MMAYCKFHNAGAQQYTNYFLDAEYWILVKAYVKYNAKLALKMCKMCRRTLNERLQDKVVSLVVETKD